MFTHLGFILARSSVANKGNSSDGKKWTEHGVNFVEPPPGYHIYTGSLRTDLWNKLWPRGSNLRSPILNYNEFGKGTGPGIYIKNTDKEI